MSKRQEGVRALQRSLVSRRRVGAQKDRVLHQKRLPGYPAAQSVSPERKERADLPCVGLGQVVGADVHLVDGEQPGTGSTC